MNKTKKFLLPCLKEYGREFEVFYHSVWKWAVGIGDIITIKSNIQYEKHIFVLLDTAKNRDAFNIFMSYIKKQPMYEADYVFDDLLKGHLHMLVLKLPEKFYNSFAAFKRSSFSEMYSAEDLNRFFEDKPELKKVLVKDNSYRVEFARQLKQEFNVIIKPEEIDGSFEFELPLKEDDEIFNTHLSN